MMSKNPAGGFVSEARTCPKETLGGRDELCCQGRAVVTAWSGQAEARDVLQAEPTAWGSANPFCFV